MILLERLIFFIQNGTELVNKNANEVHQVTIGILQFRLTYFTPELSIQIDVKTLPDNLKKKIQFDIHLNLEAKLIIKTIIKTGQYIFTKDD